MAIQETEPKTGEVVAKSSSDSSAEEEPELSDTKPKGEDILAIFYKGFPYETD